MQTSSLRTVFNLAAVNRTITRSVAVNASVNATESPPVKPWQEIPGPRSLPIIGQLYHFLPGGQLSALDDMQHALFDKYGPIVKLDGLLGSPTHIFLFDAESCATILRGENWMPVRPGFNSLEYYRKKYNKTEEEGKRPTGLITDEGENWKLVRSTANPAMLQPKTIRLYSSALQEVADDMIKRMKSKRNEKNMLDAKFDVEMNLWALESIGVVALGGRLNCFDPNLPEDSPARKLIQCVHDIFNIGSKLDFKPSLWRYIATPTFKKGMQLYKDQEDLTRYFVRKAMEELKKKGEKKSDDEKGVLEKLLEVNEEVAVIMACDMLFAGVDTAANTITGVLYLLATNQDKQDKLRAELTSGNEQRTYLKACLKEALRVKPIVGGNLRQTTKEYNILGYQIPKDMRVVFNHQHLSQSESQYPRAMEYLPERWIDKEAPYYHANAHPFAYSPFGFGVRMCIGRRIAELEIETFLTKIIQNFKVEWTGPPIKVKPSSLNYLVAPFNFIFNDIGDSCKI